MSNSNYSITSAGVGQVIICPPLGIAIWLSLELILCALA